MSDSSEISLDQLMARLAEGDRAAFTPVFERLWPPMLRLCTAMLKNPADAADAAQQALEKVLTRAADYDVARPALPWALAVASWECRTLMRRRLRRREDPERAAERLAAPDADTDPAERELIALALSALGTLSASDREALIATFWEEAASVSGATLRKRRERALPRLRAAFRRLYGLD
jgi:RNA polymerase sigma-70 factor (ECF subfamily)